MKYLYNPNIRQSLLIEISDLFDSLADPLLISGAKKMFIESIENNYSDIEIFDVLLSIVLFYYKFIGVDYKVFLDKLFSISLNFDEIEAETNKTLEEIKTASFDFFKQIVDEEVYYV